ncbi:MAG: PAS domain-containing protein, partial [Halobacteriales archaeon]
MTLVADDIHVLQVDDDPEVADLAAEYLEREVDRLAVETATSAGEGLDLLDEHDYDCVVSDYDMPGLDGIEFLDAVREDYPDLPFILFTGKGSEEVASEAISSDVTDYLQKGRGTSQYELLANRIINAVNKVRTSGELQRSQDLLQHTERLADIGGWEADVETGHQRWTEGTYAIHDLDPDSEFDPTVDDGVEFYHPEDRDEIERCVERCIEEGEPYDVELRLITAEDRLRWVRASGEPVREDGDIVTVRGAIQDITERKEREQQLERQQAESNRLQEWLDHALTATDTYVWEWDLQSDEIQRHPSTEPLFGLDSEAIGGVHEGWLDLVHPDDHAAVEQTITEGIESGEGYQVTCRVETEDGSWRWVRDIAEVETEDGEVTRAIGSVTDVTAQKEREQELERIQHRHTSLLKNTNDAIAWIEHDDETAIIRTVNPVFEDLFGPPDGDLVGRDLDNVVATGERVDEARAISRRVKNGESMSGELRRDTVHGPRDFLWQAVPIQDPETGEFDAGFAIYTDITEQRERERTLTQLVQRTDRLINTMEKAEAAEVAVEIAGEVLDARLVGVHLLSEDGERLEAAAVLDEVREVFGVPPTYGRSDDKAASDFVWEAFEQGKAMYIEDTHEYGELAEETPARSAVHQPLDDHGVFILSTTEPAAFDETDRNFIELVAQTLTAVLDRVDREADLRERERKLERLHESVRKIIGCETSDQIAERIVNAAETVLDYPLALVRYYDDTAQGLVPVATTELTEDVFDSRPTFTAEGESLNWEAYESKSPVVYDDISEIDQAVDSETPINSLMILPIGEHGTVSIGASSPEEFDKSDMAMARLLVRAAEQTLARLDREQELIRQRDELDRQNERLDQFARVISHDLRNPLNVAEGRLELAMEDCDSEHLEPVQQALARMATLIEDTLALARAGESIGDTEPVDLPELVDSCWQNVDTGQATLVTDTDASIAADLSRLQQLLENLYRNAIEHGGSDVTVTVGDLPAGFYVADDGTGIPEDERGNILDVGYTTAEEGTGFGLSIVREIA